MAYSWCQEAQCNTHPLNPILGPTRSGSASLCAAARASHTASTARAGAQRARRSACTPGHGRCLGGSPTAAACRSRLTPLGFPPCSSPHLSSASKHFRAFSDLLRRSECTPGHGHRHGGTPTAAACHSWLTPLGFPPCSSPLLSSASKYSNAFSDLLRSKCTPCHGHCHGGTPTAAACHSRLTPLGFPPCSSPHLSSANSR